jgi:hypothetical protein
MLQSGDLVDDHYDYFSASIAANTNGDVVIGCTRTGDASTGSLGYASAYAFAANSGSTTTDFGVGTVVQAGSASFAAAAGRRFGDYSNTSRDPTDPQIFWTIQQIVTTADNWATNVSEIIVPASGDARWKDRADGSISTGANWVGGSAPGSSDHVIFSRATAGTTGFAVDLPGSTTTSFNRLSVRQGTVSFNLNSGTLNRTNGGSITSSLTIGEFGGTPSISISGGTLLSQHASFAAGNLNTSSTSAATVYLNSATWSNSGSAYVGGSATASGGHATVTLGTSARATIGGNLKVYGNGTDNYNFAAGSTDHTGLAVTGTIDLSAGGRLLEDTNGERLLKAGHVVTANTGTLDLNDNDLLLTTTDATYANITSQIAYARNAGAWNRAGITSTAARIQSDHNGMLGTITGTQWNG